MFREIEIKVYKLDENNWTNKNHNYFQYSLTGKQALQ